MKKFAFVVLSASLVMMATSSRAAKNQVLKISEFKDSANSCNLLNGSFNGACLQAALNHALEPASHVTMLDLEGHRFKISEPVYVDNEAHSTSKFLAVSNGTLECVQGFADQATPGKQAFALDFSRFVHVANKNFMNLSIEANYRCNGVHFQGNYISIHFGGLRVSSPVSVGFLDDRPTTELPGVHDEADDYGGHALQIIDSTFDNARSNNSALAVNIGSADYMVAGTMIRGFQTGIKTTHVGQVLNNTIELAAPLPRGKIYPAISYRGLGVIGDNKIINGNIEMMAGTKFQGPDEIAAFGIKQIIRNEIAAPFSRYGQSVLSLSMSATATKAVFEGLLFNRKNRVTDSDAGAAVNLLQAPKKGVTVEAKNIFIPFDAQFWISDRTPLKREVADAGVRYIYQTNGLLPAICVNPRIRQIIPATAGRKFSIEKVDSSTISILTDKASGRAPAFRLKMACQ